MLQYFSIWELNYTALNTFYTTDLLQKYEDDGGEMKIHTNAWSMHCKGTQSSITVLDTNLSPLECIFFLKYKSIKNACIIVATSEIN